MFLKSAGTEGVSIIMVDSPNRFNNTNPRLQSVTKLLRIRTPPLSPPFKVGVFVVFYR